MQALLPSRTVIGLLLVFTGCLRAQDVNNSFTMDLPFKVHAATPVWLGHPLAPSTMFATLDLPIQPPDTASSLLVTVYFQEKDGGFLRVLWHGPQESSTLSDNFYEGIGMGNQRSLLISPNTLAEGGDLVFQCGDTALGIQRIRFQWLKNRSVLVSPEIQDTPVTDALGSTHLAQGLNGQPATADSPVWRDQLVTVPIIDSPQRIEQGVEFSVQLDSVPSSGRLALKENGLPWGKHLDVWINQQFAGSISPEVPDLRENGFFAEAVSSGTYVGWRNGAIYVPVSFLKTGVNTVQFSSENDLDATKGSANSNMASTTASPLAVKDVVLQLGYPPASGDAAPSTEATASTGPAITGTSSISPTTINPR